MVVTERGIVPSVEGGDDGYLLRVPVSSAETRRMPTGLMLILGPSANTGVFGLCHVRPTGFQQEKQSQSCSHQLIYGHGFGHELRWGMTAARAGRGSERLQGNIEVRGDSLRIRVYAGSHPVTGKPVYLGETGRGTGDAARRTARRTLNRLVAEAEKAHRPSSVGIPGLRHRHVGEDW
jgi:hypothetical protein